MLATLLFFDELLFFLVIFAIVVIVPRLLVPDHVNDGLERKGLCRGQFRQDLAVERHVRVNETVNEAAVGEAVLPGRRRQALNPQRAPQSLLHLAVPVRVLPGLFDAAHGNGKAVLGAAPVALGVFQQSLVLL